MNAVDISEKQAKILVIEDAHSLRRDIVEMLGFEQYDVYDAENGLKGLQAARELRPDLIVCDIMMPVMDGFEVLAELRNDPKTRTIPFVFLTARADRTDYRNGMQNGADDYVTKPFSATELLGAVRSQIKKRKNLVAETQDKLAMISGNIITAMPHELRTPLNVVLGFSNLMMSDVDMLGMDRVEEMSKHINTAGTRLLRLVENYITYAYTEILLSDGNRRELLKNGFAFAPQSAIQLHASDRAEQFERERDLVLELQDAFQIGIHDEYLKKIIEELVDNACKFSTSGTPIYVRTEIRDKYYLIEITDQGRGMKREEIEQIGAYMQFERHIYEQQGSGLGLIIAKRLAELHGGKLDVKSEEGHGTQVRVYLPVRSENEAQS